MNKATLSITVEIKQNKGIAWTSGNIYDGQFCNKLLYLIIMFSEVLDMFLQTAQISKVKHKVANT